MRKASIKTWMTVVLATFILFLKAPPASAAVQYMYESPLTVIETITDIGGNSYKYEYSFTNVDTSPIWTFGIYTTFTPDAGSASTFTMDNHAMWFSAVQAVDNMLPEYDARNFDPEVDYTVFTENPIGWPFPTEGIPSGQAVSGFSFTSNQFDSSPKYYVYETHASGAVTANGGFMAAVGQTIPEPATLLLLGMGALVVRMKRT